MPRKTLYIQPTKAAITAAKKGLEARKKAPKSKKGGLDTQQAKAEGVGSGVARARDIIAGKKVNAYQVKAFFDRHRQNYINAKMKGLKPEESRAIQAWLIWGGEPLRKQAEREVAKHEKKARNPMSSKKIDQWAAEKFLDDNPRKKKEGDKIRGWTVDDWDPQYGEASLSKEDSAAGYSIYIDETEREFAVVAVDKTRSISDQVDVPLSFTPRMKSMGDEARLLKHVNNAIDWFNRNKPPIQAPQTARRKRMGAKGLLNPRKKKAKKKVSRRKKNPYDTKNKAKFIGNDVWEYRGEHIKVKKNFDFENLYTAYYRDTWSSSTTKQGAIERARKRIDRLFYIDGLSPEDQEHFKAIQGKLSIMIPFEAEGERWDRKEGRKPTHALSRANISRLLEEYLKKHPKERTFFNSLPVKDRLSWIDSAIQDFKDGPSQRKRTREYSEALETAKRRVRGNPQKAKKKVSRQKKNPHAPQRIVRGSTVWGSPGTMAWIVTKKSPTKITLERGAQDLLGDLAILKLQVLRTKAILDVEMLHSGRSAKFNTLSNEAPPPRTSESKRVEAAVAWAESIERQIQSETTSRNPHKKKKRHKRPTRIKKQTEIPEGVEITRLPPGPTPKRYLMPGESSWWREWESASSDTGAMGQSSLEGGGSPISRMFSNPRRKNPDRLHGFGAAHIAEGLYVPHPSERRKAIKMLKEYREVLKAIKSTPRITDMEIVRTRLAQVESKLAEFGADPYRDNPRKKKAKVLKGSGPGGIKDWNDWVPGRPPTAREMITQCQKLWESYCEKPGITRLRAVAKHCEAMKASRAKSVKQERVRCMRSVRAEAKSRGWKL